MEHNLHQLNHSITTASKTLDLCLTDNPDLVISSLATDDAYLNNSPLSDHHPVSIKLNVSALAPLERVSKSFNFNRIDHEGLNRAALDSPFLPYCWTNPALLALGHEWLKPLLNKFVPLKSVHRSLLPPWISPETSHLMKKLNTLESNPKLTTSNQTKLLSLKERVSSSADDDLCTYQARLSESRNSKHIFKHLKNLKKGAHLPPVLKNGADSAHSSLEKAHMLNQYFHSVFNTKSSEPALPPEAFDYHPTVHSKPQSAKSPRSYQISTLQSHGSWRLTPTPSQNLLHRPSKPLSTIFTKSKQVRKFPSQWKIARIKPLFKDGAKDSVSNYRPVALLPCASKVFEKCIYTKVWEIISPTLSDAQYGFRKGRSCLIQLLASLNIIYNSKDKRLTTHALYLDLRKAFNKVDRSILLRKFYAKGIRGKLLLLIQDYLTNRKQHVDVDGSVSGNLNVTSGVPQGALLAVLFFLVYIDDLPELIKLVHATIFMLADDGKLIASNSHLFNALPVLEKWASTNKMCFHPSKSKVICFHGPPPEYTFCNVKLEVVDSHRDLGLLVNSSLTCSDHISLRLGKAYGALYLLKRNVSPNLSTSSKLKLYKSTVLSVLCFASSCWFPSRRDMKKTEQLRKRVTNWIIPSIKDYKNRLIKLDLLPVPLYLQMLDFLLLSNICNGQYDFNLEGFLSLEQGPRREDSIIPVVQTPKFENAQQEFFTRTCRLIRFLPCLDITKTVGLKPKILRNFWNFFETKYNENNLCTWRIALNALPSMHCINCPGEIPTTFCSKSDNYYYYYNATSASAPANEMRSTKIAPL